jgi:hypothetical protein
MHHIGVQIGLAAVGVVVVAISEAGLAGAHLADASLAHTLGVVIDAGVVACATVVRVCIGVNADITALDVSERTFSRACGVVTGDARWQAVEDPFGYVATASPLIFRAVGFICHALTAVARDKHVVYAFSLWGNISACT